MKIYTFVGNNLKLQAAIQEEIFAAGGKWADGTKEISLFEFPNAKFFYDRSGLTRSCAILNTYEEVSIPEFIERVREFHAKKMFSIVLNSEYTANWTQGDDFVQAGCQKVPVDKVLEFAEVIKNNK